VYRRLLLLGLLAQREMHGYKLNEFLDKYLHICSDLKKSTAYFLLEKLAEEGYVATTTVRAGNYPERKVFSLTPAGRAYFLRLLRENLAAFTTTYYPGDVGLAFMHELPPAERLALLRERREGLVAQLAALRSAPPHGGALDFVIERNVALLEAERAWLDGVLERAGEVEGWYVPQEDDLAPEGAV
jgi:DNA-binding PadR family transcriptional regulator